MRYFCTLFDVNYLPNFLALYDSLNSNTNGEMKIYAFCMDEASYSFLQDYEQEAAGKIVSVSLKTLLSVFPQLAKIKAERAMVEFYFTCSPFICTYLLKEEPSSSHITYLDADLLFFNSPELLFKEIGESSVAIISHKFYGWGERYTKYGKYNVGWLTFKNDNEGRKCLHQWLKDCEEWCFDYYDEENQRFGDQKYLDKWEGMFKNVKVIEQKGANLAPWNAGQYQVTKKNDNLFVDEDPLVFHHFASFKKVADNVFTTSMSRYMARPSSVLKRQIYSHYLNKVLYFSDMVNQRLASNDTEAQKRNRPLVYKTNFKKKITNYFTSFTRWFFNDYIYK